MEDRPPTASMDAFSVNAKKAGKTASKSFMMRIEPAPNRIADRLGIDRDELVVVRVLKQLLDGEPWSIEIGYYPRDIATEVGLDVSQDIAQGTIRKLRDAGYVEVAHIDEVTYETAAEQDAHDLGVSPGAPLLVQTRTAATADRVTRCMSYLRIAERNRLIWEVGADAGLDVIRSTRRQEAAE